MKNRSQLINWLIHAAILIAIVLLLHGKVFGDAQTYRQALKSTTWVLAKNSSGTSTGTGVLIDSEKKLMVTNSHVVGDARNTVVFFPAEKKGRTAVDRDYYLDNVTKLGIRGRVVAVDRKRDLALVQLSKIPDSAIAIPFATESPTPGEQVESIGNSGSSDALWVYTSGTVRTVYQKKFRTASGERDFRVVETQSPLNPGDSGGPVVNSAGELVAVSQAILPKARLVSFCVAIEEVRDFLNSPWRPAPLPSTKILEAADMKFVKHQSGHFQVEVDADDDEKTAAEQVFLSKDVEYYERADVRKIWSLAQQLDEEPSAETSLRLLQQNARTKLGAWTIEKAADGKFMVIYCVKIDATATHDTVKSTMQYVAKLTESMRKELTPKQQKKSSKETLSDWLSN